MLIAEIFFFLFLFLLLHAYVFYPITIYLLAQVRSKQFKTSPALPSVTVIISAYNEESVIEETIRTMQKSNYPAEKFEILVGTDCSEDKTNEIISRLVKEYSNISFHAFTRRRGKAHVLNDLIPRAKGEIIVFADANTLYHPDAIRQMVKYYSDERVGGVSGKLILNELKEARESGSHEDDYWNYETLIKISEGKLGILIGSNGGIYSIRKGCFVPNPINHPVSDDLYISMKVLEAGKAVIYAPEAVAEEYIAPSAMIEYRRKIRTTSNNLYTMKALTGLLKKPFTLISYCLWSHKILRWLSPFFFIGLLVTNIFLYNQSNFYFLVMLLQGALYLFSGIGYLLRNTGKSIFLFSLPFYLTMTNIALLIGVFKFLSGAQTGFWQSTKR